MRPLDGPSLAPPLGTVSARVMLVAFAVVHGALTIGPGPTPAATTVFALGLTVSAAAVVVLAPGRRLSATATAVVVVLTVTGCALIVPGLPGRGWPGYASWPLGADTFIAIALTLRQRIAPAWITMAAMVALCLDWGILGGEGIVAGLGLIERQIGVLLVGTLFAIGLRRAARSAADLDLLQRRQALELGALEAELQARSDAILRVLADAGPTLERIAAGAAFDEQERGRIIALEGRLRDDIALGPLLTVPLERAMSDARSRGLDVAVHLDPAIGAATAAARIGAAAWIAERLDAASGSAIVARAVLRDGHVRVSATVDGGDEEVLLVGPEGPVGPAPAAPPARLGSRRSERP